MSRFESRFIYCFVGLLLMLVIGGCGPGSTGSGTGPASVIPPVGGALATPALPAVPGNNLLTGSSFSNAAILGTWYDVTSGTVIEISPDKIRFSAACTVFEYAGTWGGINLFATQVTGSYSVQASPSNGSAVISARGRLVLALPGSDQLYVELIDNQGISRNRLTSMIRLPAESSTIAGCN